MRKWIIRGAVIALDLVIIAGLAYLANRYGLDAAP